MIDYLPLSRWPAPLIPIYGPVSHLDQIEWVPLGDGEVMLTAHYFPLAVCFDGARPVLGALTRRDVMTRELVTAAGKWTGAYVPVALRCYPLRVAGRTTGDPIADLEIAKLPVDDNKPRTIRIRDDAGTPSAELKAIYDGLKSVADARDSLATGLDLALVADVLVPIPNFPDAPSTPRYYTVERKRFGNASNRMLEAMSRHSFASIDLITALTFSQANLHARLRPASVHQATANSTAAEQSYPFDDVAPWLDTSELFPGAWAADPAMWLPEKHAPGAAPAQTVNAPASQQQGD